MKRKICLILILVLTFVFVLMACETNGKETQESSEQYSIYLMAKDSGYTGTYDEWLASIKGADGINGREIELSVVDENIVWRYVGATEWKKIYSVNDLIGPKGDNGADGQDGQDGSDGKDGVSITKAEINAKGELVLTFSDGNTSNLGVIKGDNGADGQDGQDGSDGKDGVSITKVEINAKGELVLTFSDGNSSNLGVVKGADGVTNVIEHKFVKKNDDTYSWEECSECGITKNIHRHAYDNTNICTICGHEMRDCFRYNLLADGTYSIARFYTSGYPEVEKMVIPSKYNGKDITAIEDYAFDHNYYITDISIPGSIKSIGERAFCNCNKLVSVDFANGIKHIGNEAFASCYKLDKIVIPESIKSIGDGAFDGFSIKEVTLPYCLENIGEVFSRPNTIKALTLTGGTKIAENAFHSFGNLAKVYIPESVTSIGSNAFSMCSSLVIYAEAKSAPTGWQADWNSTSRPVVWDAKNNDVADDGNIYIIDNGMNYVLKDGKVTLKKQGSSSAEHIVVPDSIKYKNVDYKVTAIEDGAFRDFNSVKSITLPFAPAHIGDIFDGYDPSYSTNRLPESLKEVVLTGGTTIDGCAFSLCQYIESIKIPSTVIEIEPSAFLGCHALTNIVVDSANKKYTSRDTNDNECNVIVDKTTSTLVIGCGSTVIPDSVITIGDSAFFGNVGLRNIDIPSNVRNINAYAFYACTSLQEIIIPSSIINMGSQVFSTCSSLLIYTEAPSQPSTWATDWNPDNRPVVWNFKSFSKNVDYEYMVYNDNTVTISRYIGKNTAVDIPSQIDGNSVIGIDNYAFSGSTSLTSITIPSGVTSIGDSAFSGCTSLTSITIPSSVTNIGEYAFSSCNNLTIYAEAPSQPSTWSASWNYHNRPVVWGHKGA